MREHEREHEGEQVTDYFKTLVRLELDGVKVWEREMMVPTTPSIGTLTVSFSSKREAWPAKIKHLQAEVDRLTRERNEAIAALRAPTSP